MQNLEDIPKSAMSGSLFGKYVLRVTLYAALYYDERHI